MGRTVYSHIELNTRPDEDSEDRWKHFIDSSLYIGYSAWYDTPGLYAPNSQIFEKDLLRHDFPEDPSREVKKGLVNIFADSNAISIAERYGEEVTYSGLVKNYESKGRTPSVYTNNFKELIEADYDKEANIDAERERWLSSENSGNLEAGIKHKIQNLLFPSGENKDREDLESNIETCLNQLASYSNLVFPNTSKEPIKDKHNIVKHLESELDIDFQNNLAAFLELAQSGSAELNGHKIKHKPLKRRELIVSRWFNLLRLVEKIIEDKNEGVKTYSLEDIRIIVYVSC